MADVEHMIGGYLVYRSGYLVLMGLNLQLIKTVGPKSIDKEEGHVLTNWL